MDNSIRVYDLSVKKGGSQMVYAERSHRNMVTAIKFSSDFRYLISGDADGVIHHYQRITDES
jgi:WD40 repeat protein